MILVQDTTTKVHTSIRSIIEILYHPSNRRKITIRLCQGLSNDWTGFSELNLDLKFEFTTKEVCRIEKERKKRFVFSFNTSNLVII